MRLMNADNSSGIVITARGLWENHSAIIKFLVCDPSNTSVTRGWTQRPSTPRNGTGNGVQSHICGRNVKSLSLSHTLLCIHVVRLCVVFKQSISKTRNSAFCYLNKCCMIYDGIDAIQRLQPISIFWNAVLNALILSAPLSPNLDKFAWQLKYDQRESSQCVLRNVCEIHRHRQWTPESFSLLSPYFCQKAYISLRLWFANTVIDAQSNDDYQPQ